VLVLRASPTARDHHDAVSSKCRPGTRENTPQAGQTSPR
jgi:hypothetical protein